MKFKINREYFFAGLQLVTNVVSNRKTMPILQNVLLQASKDSVFLTTTNLDLGINCCVKAEVEKEGTVTLPVRELSKIVRELADIEVDVETSDGTKVSISTRVPHLIYSEWIVRNTPLYLDLKSRILLPLIENVYWKCLRAFHMHSPLMKRDTC